MSPILKLDHDDEEREQAFELDYLLSLTTKQRVEMMVQRSNEVKRMLIRLGFRKPVEIIKREMPLMETTVRKSADFELTGSGTSPEWDAAEWLPLTPVAGTAPYASRAKALWSPTGLYFLFDCPDRRLTCTMAEDFDDIYNEDVVEVFLWPDERQVLYFEYEISPLGVELPILVPNRDGAFMGWRPWHYEGERRVRRATAARGGEKAPMAEAEGWTAECFIPFALLKGLGNMPPQPGARWRANLYRIDYDERPATHWAWSPASGANFHNVSGFGALLFD